MNCSEALSIAIRGLLNTTPRGTHAIATAMEHNSVLRPLNALARQVGAPVTLISAALGEGLETVYDFLEGAIGSAERAQLPVLRLPVISDAPECRRWAAVVGTEAH